MLYDCWKMCVMMGAICSAVSLIEREPRTVIHVKRANMFDHMGLFEVPSVSRKLISGRFGVGLSPQNHPLKSAKNWGNKIGFYLCKKGQG